MVASAAVLEVLVVALAEAAWVALVVASAVEVVHMVASVVEAHAEASVVEAHTVEEDKFCS